MPELNPEHITAVIAAINDCPFFQHLSMEVTEMGFGYSVARAQILKKHMNPFGGLHGGVYAAVIDTAAYWSAYCDLSENAGLISIDLKVDFLAPLIEGDIIVRGQRIKAGRTIYLTEAKVFDENGKLLAHGTSKLMVTRDKQSIDDVADYMGTDKLPKKFMSDSPQLKPSGDSSGTRPRTKHGQP